MYKKKKCTFHHTRSNLSLNNPASCKLQNVVAQSREYFYFLATKFAQVLCFTGQGKFVLQHVT